MDASMLLIAIKQIISKRWRGEQATKESTSSLKNVQPNIW